MPRSKNLLRVVGRVVVIAVAHMAVVGPMHANPRGGVVARGQATIDSSNPALMTVRQHTDRAVINWQGFSNSAGEAIRFAQPGPKAAILNRVTGSESSVIDGALSANGRVFLLNPNGVLIGKNAQVNVGGLVASSLAMSDADFEAGRHTLRQGPGKLAAVVNKGKIQTTPGGSVALVAPLVANEGEISAPGGRVALAAGTSAVLSLDEGGLVSVGVREGGGAPGNVEVSEEAASRMMEDVVNTGAVVDAGAVTVRNGVLELKGAEGVAIHGGKISVDGEGGMSAGRVQVESTQRTVLAPGSVITANGRGAGSNGGQVRALSAGTTDFAREARIEAKGAEEGGDGGFVEVSGRHVSASGTVSTRGGDGKAGTLLIDPATLTIDNTSAGVDSIGVDDINGNLAGGDVQIFADDSITFRNTADIVQTSNPSSRIAFTVTGTGSGIGGISVDVDGQPGSITAEQIVLQSRNVDNRGIDLHNANAAGGDVVLHAPSAILLVSSSPPGSPVSTLGVGTDLNPIIADTPTLGVESSAGGGAFVQGTHPNGLAVTTLSGATIFGSPDFPDIDSSLSRSGPVVGDFLARTTLGTLVTVSRSESGLGVAATGSLRLVTDSPGANIVLNGSLNSPPESFEFDRPILIQSAGNITASATSTIFGSSVTLGAATGIGTIAVGGEIAVTTSLLTLSNSVSGGSVVTVRGAQFVPRGLLVDSSGTTMFGVTIIRYEDSPTAPAGTLDLGAMDIHGPLIVESAADMFIAGNVSSNQGVELRAKGSIASPLSTVAAPFVTVVADGGILQKPSEPDGPPKPFTVDSPVLFVNFGNGATIRAIHTEGTAILAGAFGVPSVGDLIVSATKGGLDLTESAIRGRVVLETLEPGRGIFGGTLVADSVFLNSAGPVGLAGDSIVARSVFVTSAGAITVGGRLEADNITLDSAGTIFITGIAAGSRSAVLNSADAIRVDQDIGAAEPRPTAGSIVAGNVLLSAVNGVGTAAAPINVDTSVLQLRNLGSGGAHVIDSSLTLMNLDTQASTIAGDLRVEATRAALTVNSFGASARGDILLRTQTAGTDVFAVGAVTGGATRSTIIDSAGGIGGAGFLSGGTVQLKAAGAVGSAATPLNVNSANIGLHSTGNGGAFLNVGNSVSISGEAKGSFQLDSPGDINFGTVAATGAFNVRAGGSILNGAAASSDNLVGGAGANELRASGIIGTRSNPLQLNIRDGTLFVDPANAKADGVSASFRGTLLPENNLRLATPPGSILLNDIVVFAPPVNLFADGQLNSDGETLIPENFDLSQAALSAATIRNAWSSDSGDRSMGTAGSSGRVYVEDNLAGEMDERDEADKPKVGAAGDAP